MAVFKIPLIATPQRFEITLGGITYIMTCKYNDSEQSGWIIDLADSETSEPIAACLPLITGANILQNLDYLGFTGELRIFTDSDPRAVPTFTNLGTESNLYFVTEDAPGG